MGLGNGNGKVSMTDWKVFLAIAGASFFANLVALVTVVNVMLAPVKVGVAQNASSIQEQKAAVASVLGELHSHETIIGHAGMQEIVRRLEENVQWIRNRLESTN